MEPVTKAPSVRGLQSKGGKVIASGEKEAVLLKTQNLTERMRQIMVGCATCSREARGPGDRRVRGMGPQTKTQQENELTWNPGTHRRCLRSEQRAGEGLDEWKVHEGRGDLGGPEKRQPVSHGTWDSSNPVDFMESQSKVAYRGGKAQRI